MLLLLPSLLCSAYSDFSIDDLPTILCTISFELIRIFSATSSHNSHLLHTFCTHAIFIVVLSINDKHTSMCCLLNICQQHQSSILTQALTFWCLPKWGTFITFSRVDYMRFIVHDWGIIFEFFPLVLVRYLCGVSML
jgi:hypothetical protein